MIVERLQNLVGTPVVDVQFSYADVLCVDLGELVPYDHPRLAHRHHGRIELVVLCSDWAARSETGPLAAADADQRLDDNRTVAGTLHPLVGRHVERVELADDLGLRLVLSGGAELVLTPSTSEKDEDGFALPYWELFDGDRCISADQSGELTIWDAEQPMLEQQTPLARHRGAMVAEQPESSR